MMFDYNESNVNRSSYVFMVQFKRTIDDFYENHVIGKGLGTYTYIKNSIKLKKYALADFSSIKSFRLDGSTSLLFKIIVEFGLFGIIILFIILYRYYVFNLKYINRIGVLKCFLIK